MKLGRHALVTAAVGPLFLRLPTFSVWASGWSRRKVTIRTPSARRKFLPYLVWWPAEISARQATYSVLPGADQINQFRRWGDDGAGADVPPLPRRFAGDP